MVLGRNSRVDFKLEVGQITQSVTISADAAMVDTTTNYGIPNTTAIYYSGASTTLPPPALRAANGWIAAAVGFTTYDVYERKNYNADVSYILNWHGQHNLKGGWSMNQLSDDLNSLSYPNGYYRYYWGIGYTCITSQCSGKQQGKPAYGRLATDRPNAFKFFGSYQLKAKLGHTTFSPNVALYSGTPLTTEVNVISSTPMMPYGRGDLGRSPWFHNFDFNVLHDFIPFKNNESMKIRFELSIFNLFNNATVTDLYKTMGHGSDGYLQFDDYATLFKGFDTKALMKAQGMRTDPQYGRPSSLQGPRSLRMQVAFFWKAPVSH